MSETFQCGNNAVLTGYLYGECDASERTAIAAHVTVCAACAAELAALESTRVQLAAWIPPEAELGFIMRPRPPVEPAGPPLESGRRAGRWFTQPLPAWTQLAAAAVIFAAGLSLGIARGAAPAAAPVEATIAEAPQAPSEGVSSAELTALERRLRGEIATMRTTASPDATTASLPPETQLMTRVRALIEESEQRQQQELALRTAEIVRDFDSQRRVDLTQIQRNFGQIEGLTGAEVREQRQMLNYLMRVSQQR